MKNQRPSVEIVDADLEIDQEQLSCATLLRFHRIQISLLMTTGEKISVKRELCPGCGAANGHLLYECAFTEDPIRSYLKNFYGQQGRIDVDELKGMKYALKECIACGLIYQYEILGDHLMEKLYEKWIDPKLVFEEEEKQFGVDFYAREAQEVGSLISYFNTIPTKLKFLDFGMGWGKWLKMAVAFGVQSYGTELSQSRIDYAKRFGIDVLTWDELPHHQFDLVNTEQVFEHIPEPLETLRHLKKSVRSGGLLKISVPNGSGVKKRLKNPDWTIDKKSKNSLNAVSPLEHINCFQYESILRMAGIVGLKPVRIPLKAQYSFLCNNSSLRSVAVNIAKPLYRNYFKSTYLFFTPE